MLGNFPDAISNGISVSGWNLSSDRWVWWPPHKAKIKSPPQISKSEPKKVLNIFQNWIQNLLSPELSLSQTKTQFRIIQTPKELKISLESSPKVKHHKSQKTRSLNQNPKLKNVQNLQQNEVKVNLKQSKMIPIKFLKSPKSKAWIKSRRNWNSPNLNLQ